MSFFATVFLLVAVAFLLTLPRHRAPLPLLIGTCYMTLGQGIELGPFTFSVIRILVAVGVVRVIIRGERLAGPMNGLDKLMIAWAVWALTSSGFHTDPQAALVLRLGLVYNSLGIYFLLRVFCQSTEDVMSLCLITAIVLIPVSIAMIVEKSTAHNFFSAFGGVHAAPSIREGKVRAQGPFGHSILAGTVGAICLPLVVALWRQHRRLAWAGIGACGLIVFSSSSSGPIMSAAAAVGALMIWRRRHLVRTFRWAMVAGYLGLELIMNDPAYFILARIDVAGGSTGWYRARLIQSAFQHLDTWWWAGTDYTRNWMPSGVPWNPNHVDITNHYLKMGVLGGLPLMLLLIAILVAGFRYVGQILRWKPALPPDQKFLIWSLGASLFTTVVSGIGVSFFDQSFLFLYISLAAIGSVKSGLLRQTKKEPAQVETACANTAYQAAAAAKP